ncbi:predicted protein [Plenodomus lingam JN3]|uniref:Predicted protein n=1 Tax=Leptosphaeria maculans (strain JN3 / isolate v23.1.3 / race Av1-4-5-6-7-8) TaxID=985895 RepID=E4ZRV7_LEPMJ|nr:predicted protein [Plenodomus lingam JN3]CBX93954.1 predicted protein [Plenodomus lingam JN3]
MSSPKRAEFVLFGDSLTEWGFDEDTRGFGWYLRQLYAGKVDVVNEVLFGASMVQWSFEEETQVLGWVLGERYRGEVEVVNEG